jgi:hypothetical protein
MAPDTGFRKKFARAGVPRLAPQPCGLKPLGLARSPEFFRLHLPARTLNALSIGLTCQGWPEALRLSRPNAQFSDEARFHEPY